LNLIEIRDLKKYYNKGKNTEVKALNGINLDIEKGDFCSIIGVSGSGKSTLLHILGCIDKQTEGLYKFNGVDVLKKNEKERAQLRNKTFGFILQDFGLIEEETVYRNTCIPLLFSNSRRHKDVYQILKQLDIYEIKDKKVKQLSGGQRQRVAIARALVNDPEVIFADEPTGALDTKTTEIIMKILINLNKEGKTIIIVTHNMEIAKITNKCFTIKDGIICKA